MSYIALNALNAKRLEIAEITLSGSPGVNGYFTFNTLNNHTFGTAPSGLNSNTLTLPKGSYMFRSCFDITRTNSNNNYQFQFEVSNSLIGLVGQTGFYNNKRSDLAEATYESDASFNLKLKAVNIEGQAPTLTNDSKLFIWRVERD